MAKKSNVIKSGFLQDSRKVFLTYHALALFCLIVSLLLLYYQYYAQRFYPNTYLDDVAISKLTKAEAKEKILRTKYQNTADWQSSQLTLFHGEQMVSDSLANLELRDNLDATLDQAWQVGHQPGWLRNLFSLIGNRLQPRRFYSHLTYNQEKVDALLSLLEEKVYLQGERASATLPTSGNSNSLTINPGSLGQELQLDDSREIIAQHLDKNLKDLRLEDLQIELPLQITSQELNAEQLAAARARAAKLVGQQIVFTYDYQRFVFNDQDLIALLIFADDINQDGIDQEQLGAKIALWAKAVDQPAQNAEFTYDPQTLVVSKFVPDHPATVLDQAQVKSQTLETLDTLLGNSETPPTNTSQFALPVSEEPAAVTLGETNELGIKEIIGFGESWYDHSIPARIHNVALTARKLNNTLLAPGAEFRFNTSLGDVSTETEYKAAYIIQNGQTILAPGGGVCQVSSTLFRALLDAGLQITKRLPHSYRVSYYEINNEPGFDATVYSGNIDLRFVNDTDHYILLNLSTDSENLYMNVKIYGTSDGRSTEIINYRKWDYRPAAASVYLDDPSLPVGTIKQIDWSATGIKAEFTNVVRDKNGQVMHQDYYYSNYQPWSAKYLVGTAQ